MTSVNEGWETARVSTAAQARPGAPEPPDTALDTLLALVTDDLKAVNRIIVERMDSEVELIPQLAGYIVASGGKRLRPLLTLASAQLCRHSGSRHQGLAAAVEFIHTATLLHDDVVDGSDLRRGNASANEVFGNKPSVLVGDFLFARAFQLMVEDGSLDVLRILSTASAVIAEGEVMQLAASNDLDTTEAIYLRVIEAKTAALFAAACRIGAVVADRPTAEEEALEQFGRNLGVAFQLVDDVLDYSAHQARLGKSIGDDFREGKVTLPVVLACARGDSQERAFWKRCVEDLDQRDGDLDQALDLMRQHRTLEDSVARARQYADAACAALAVFPPSQARDALLGIVSFCVEREY